MSRLTLVPGRIFLIFLFVAEVFPRCLNTWIVGVKLSFKARGCMRSIARIVFPSDELHQAMPLRLQWPEGSLECEFEEVVILGIKTNCDTVVDCFKVSDHSFPRRHIRSLEVLEAAVLFCTHSNMP